MDIVLQIDIALLRWKKSVSKLSLEKTANCLATIMRLFSRTPAGV